MRYVFALALGFLLVGIFYGTSLLAHRYLLRGESALSYFAPLLAAFVPTVLILWRKGDWSPHLENLLVPSYWALTLGGTAVVCALVLSLRKREATICSGRELWLRCVEAGTMEVPQRLMAQSFLCLLLAVWGLDVRYAVLLNALVWCLGICVQGIGVKMTRAELAVDLVSSFLFSLAVGWVYYRSGYLVYCIAAHMLERYVTTRFAKIGTEKKNG